MSDEVDKNDIIGSSSIAVDIKSSPKSQFTITLLVGAVLIFVQLLFAGYGVVSIRITKDEELDVFFLTFCRSLISAVLTLLVAIAFDRKLVFPPRPNSKEIFYFSFFGLVSSCLNPIMYLYVLKFVSGSYVTVLGQLVPLFNTIFSFVLQIEKIKSFFEEENILKIFGILTGCSFAVAITCVGFQSPSDNTTPLDWVYASLIGILNNLSYSLYVTFQAKYFYKNQNSILRNKPFTIHAYCHLFGAVIYAFFATPYLIINKDTVYNFPAIGIVPILYSSVLCSVLGHGLLTWCNLKSSPMAIGASFSFQVAVTLILLLIFTTERMHTSQYILSAGVILSVLLVIFSPVIRLKRFFLL